MQNFLSNQNKHYLFLILLLVQVFFVNPTQVLADLPTGNAIKDPNAILRNALPIKQFELQEIQLHAKLVHLSQWWYLCENRYWKSFLYYISKDHKPVRVLCKTSYQIRTNIICF